MATTTTTPEETKVEQTEATSTTPEPEADQEAKELRNPFLAQCSLKASDDLYEHRLVLVRILKGSRSQQVTVPAPGALAQAIAKQLTKAIPAEDQPWTDVEVRNRKENAAAGPGYSYEVLTIADSEPSKASGSGPSGKKKTADMAKLQADIKAHRAAGLSRREAFFKAYLAQNFSEAQATDAWNDLYGD